MDSGPQSGNLDLLGDVRFVRQTDEPTRPPDSDGAATLEADPKGADVGLTGADLKGGGSVYPDASPSNLILFVRGNPVAQGSLKGYGRGRMVNDNPELDRWRGQVYSAAREAWAFAPPMDGPIRVTLYFYVMSPRKRRHRADHVRSVDTLTKPYWLATVGAHDIDKLARAVLDALTSAKVWQDDGLVCDLRVMAFFAAPPDIPPGARIYVEAIE